MPLEGPLRNGPTRPEPHQDRPFSPQWAPFFNGWSGIRSRLLNLSIPSPVCGRGLGRGPTLRPRRPPALVFVEFRQRGPRALALARSALSLTLPPQTGGGARKDSRGIGTRYDCLRAMTSRLWRWMVRRRVTAFFLIVGGVVGVGGLTVQFMRGCFVGGRFHDSGYVFSPDGCNDCACVEGSVSCTMMACVPARRWFLPDRGARAHRP